MKAISEVRAVLTLEIVQNDKVTSSVTVSRSATVGLYTSDEKRSKSSAVSAIHNLVPEMTTDAAVGVMYGLGDH